ncbi:hypothetical protein PGW94_01905 [Candidatus Anaplasma sp. TIGMIC]|nr:hypothetical protein [Candidatus Anaplasma sp. TIGMIC]
MYGSSDTCIEDSQLASVHGILQLQEPISQMGISKGARLPPEYFGSAESSKHNINVQHVN